MDLITWVQLLFSVLKDIFLTVAALIGAYVAWKGLDAWKQQLHGRTEYDLAKRILKLTFQYRDAIAKVRHPAIWAHEMALSPEDEQKQLTPEQKQFLRTQRSYEARWAPVESIRRDLYPELLEAEVLWDNEVNSLVQPLLQLEKDLFRAIQDHLVISNPDLHPEENFHLREAEINKSRSMLLYQNIDKSDPFKEEFERKLKEVEDFLKKFLKRS